MDRNSRRLCWLLDMHSIELNWPEGLPPFVHKLQTDRHLAMDFWALVRSLRRGEAAGLGDQQIIALVVSCVCGSNPLPWSRDNKAALSDFSTMLAGSDAATDPDTNLPDALLVPESASTQPIASEWPGTFENELEKLRIADDSFQATKLPVNPGHPPSSTFTMSHALSQHHLDEALSRLELTSLELKVHLDNLDSRMSRIEPHLEGITSLVASTLAAPSTNGARNGATPGAPIPEASSHDTSTPRSSPEQQIADTSHAPRIPAPSHEPDIFFRDSPGNWLVTSTFSDYGAKYAAKAKTAWASRSQWKSALPTLPPYLLPELKEEWLEARQSVASFVNSRLRSTNVRQVAIVASILVGALVSGTILVGAYRHPAGRHVTPPHEVKAIEQPAEPDPKSVGDSNPAPIPSAVTSSHNLQQSNQSQVIATTAPQTNTQKKKQGDDYVAKPTFKWLGDEPNTSSRNKNDKSGADKAP
jgi:hypothetical protein